MAHSPGVISSGYKQNFDFKSVELPSALNDRKKLFYLILVSTLLRMLLAYAHELGNVEAYYWALATKLEWNYFDHPPIVAWLIRLTTLNLSLHGELYVRLGAILASSVCTWLMFLIGSILYNSRAGWFAALLYATSFYSGINVAAHILPDSPQMVFWLASIYTLINMVRLEPDDPQYARHWIIFGLLAGLCMMCKVHGVFLWLGAAMYFLIYNRAGLKNKYVFMAMGLTIIIISPVIIWNIQHHFITYKFHSNRVNIGLSKIDGVRFIKQLSEIIFSTGPIHFALICISIFHIIKGNVLMGKSELRLILLCCLPLILIISVMGVFNVVLPHWPGPALSTLLVLPAIGLAARRNNENKSVPNVLKLSISYCILIAFAGYLSIACCPGTLSTEKEGLKTGADDATLSMYGWKQLGKKFDSVYQFDVSARLMPANASIVVTDWITAAHIDYYIGKHLNLETRGLGDPYNLHQYFWMNNYKKPLRKGENAYLIIPSELYSYKKFNKVVDDFKDYNFAMIFPEYRSGIICRVFYVVRLYGYKGQTNGKMLVADAKQRLHNS